ncbi:MAG: Mrp/NBP35 family ATP-binding protein [Bacteroidales bacterium]|nr:Mrp/NBP35 family ATP-binding protein [Bacteroidales bacterium]MBN2762402.1 Mrp/NBP35 family ATP-binding protein [Bacteroidales bacterium]
MNPKKVFEKIELPNVKNIIVIASGKGGVGKSTVSANLAVSLARQGFKTALVDADLYGPSIPMMFGVQNERPVGGMKDGKEVIIPIEKYGVKMVSIGFFISAGQSLIWRGPMASNGLTQLFRDTDWGETDYMIVDFPPGTGDIQITTVQKLNLSGAVIVTTPQEVAISDARKAASMFINPDLNVPLLGIVENMSWFTPANHPDEKYFIFGQGGGEKLTQEFNTKLLGQIPLIMEIGEGSDKGMTVYNQSNKSMIDAFDTLSQSICEILSVKA